VIEAFAGLRVLPTNGKTLNARPRETRIIADRPHAPRLVSIYGGKFTAYRATAQKVLGPVSSSLPALGTLHDTRAIRLEEPK
jgi:glycerol-3-phosphate dehydrogenase